MFIALVLEDSVYLTPVVGYIEHIIRFQASDQWPAVQRWLQERNAKLYPESAGADQFKILGYQWRVMRFNDHTRQSTAKVMTCYRTGSLRSLYLMQQPHCLAVPCEFTYTLLASIATIICASLFILYTSSIHLPC
jgi:hypothetical protein